MAKICIASVFTDDNRSKTWYQLQMKFIKKTTSDFDHFVFLNGDQSNVYTESTIIGQGTYTRDDTQFQSNHLIGLNAILDFFRKNSQKYEYFLVLDSDCFPVSPDWFFRLSSNDFEVSACVRYENLDSFAHPCVVFMKRSYLEKALFKFDDCTNIIGYTCPEVHFDCKEFFPLIRTNRVNLHPIMYGIYYDCFYHHAAGSRNVFIRSIDLNSYYDPDDQVSPLERFESIKKSPDLFVNKLMNKKSVKMI